MKIALIQFAPAFNDETATINQLGPLLDNVADADFVVLPELCNSGYHFLNQQQAFESSTTISDSPFIAFLKQYALQNKQYIVSGINERVGDHLYNASVLISKDGVVGHYRKLHLFLNEKDFFTPGNLGLPVFDIGFCKIGMLVCFDWMFPEAWRKLAVQGAQLIAHPCNLVLPGFAQKAIPIHALINRVFVVTSNRIGTEGPLAFTGMSTIAAPDSTVLYQAEADTIVTPTIAIDPQIADNKWITARNHALTDRRLDFY